MALSLSPLAEQLLGDLEQLPTNENPYTFIIGQLNARLLPTLPDSAAKQLYFLAAVFGLAGILILVSHLIRIKKNAIWVFRWQPEYKLIRVHATLSWSIPAILVVALFEVLIARTIQLANGNSKSDYGYWLLLVWGSAWVSGCIATWALASSFIVHLHTNGESRQPPKPIHSQLCNVLGIAAPIVYLAILLPLGIIAGQHYAASQRTATQIKRFLNAAASQWSPGTSYSIATLAPGFPLLALLEDQVGELIKWWKAVFMFYAVSAIVLLAPISSISYLYLTSLRRTINLTAQELGQSIGRNRASQRQIKHTWISLVVIMSAFTILASIFFIVSIYAYVRPTSLRRDSTFQGLIFSPLYAFALGGTPCAAVLVFRAIETRSTEKKRSTEGEKEGSNCWSAVWSGSKSSGNTAVDARERGEMQGRDSEAISFGAMLRGFGGGTGGGVGTRRGRGDDELTRSVGAGSSVVVRVEVEVREDGGGSSGEEMKKEREKTFDRI